MDLRQLIAKMDQIEKGPAWLQEPDWLNEDDNLDEDPLLLVGLGIGLKWLWDKYQQSQAEAEAAKKAAEDAKRAGDAAEAARLAAEALKKAQEAADDKRRAEEANGSKCKAKVGQVSAYISQLDDMLKKEAAKKAAGPAPGPHNQPKAVIGSGSVAQGPARDGVPATKDNIAAKPAGGIAQYPSAKESINFNSSIANALIESFGYDTPQKKSQVDEWSKQDTGDTIRAGFNGLTFGAGDNLQAAVKSAFGKDTYAQALEKERAETNRAQERSPSLKFSTPALKIGDKELIGKKDWAPSVYDAANLAGAVLMPIPGVGLAGQAAARTVKGIAGTGKVAKAAAGTAGLTGELAATYGALKGAEHFLDKHTVTTLVTAKGGDVRLGLAQAAMGMDDKEVDGKMGRLTRAALEIVQDENKLPVTGKLDIATAKVLGV